MPQPAAVSAEHSVRIAASADFVYEMLADVDTWPETFASFVHLELLGAAAGTDPEPQWERVAVWSHSGDQLHRWVKRRALRPELRRIDYSPEEPMPLLTSMRRSFVVEPVGDQASRLRLIHEYHPVDDDPDGLDAIAQTIDEIANAELAAVRAAAEPLALRPELRQVFGETVWVEGSASDVYDFLWQIRTWPAALPHALMPHARTMQSSRR
ncbi:aromatase/cyclase [Salinispora oceanensis]|uniref:aromatase/cyclase n=1 Tax=Salinispora oceanensis TaxID=1050199 RepID=UPI00036ECD58|nr:aromatase/cyclase [Salinispora oceanensis]